ncbi:hypothetical protein Agub_g7708, partial [Astrephomene gubernaculifera]
MATHIRDNPPGGQPRHAGVHVGNAGTNTTQAINSRLLLDLQAALSAALGVSGQSQASQSDPLVMKLRSGITGLLNACADASRHGGGLQQDVVTVLSVASFVVDRLPTVFCGEEGLDTATLCSLLGLLVAAAGRYRSLVDRMVGLLLRLVELAAGPGERRELLRDLAAGTMELLLDAEQQLLLLSLPASSWGEAAAPGGLGPVVSAFECLCARSKAAHRTPGPEQGQDAGEQAPGGGAGAGGQQGAAPEAPADPDEGQAAAGPAGGSGGPVQLTVQLGTVSECLAAADAGCALLGALLQHRPHLLAPLVPPLVPQ